MRVIRGARPVQEFGLAVLHGEEGAGCPSGAPGHWDFDADSCHLEAVRDPVESRVFRPAGWGIDAGGDIGGSIENFMTGDGSGRAQCLRIFKSLSRVAPGGEAAHQQRGERQNNGNPRFCVHFYLLYFRTFLVSAHRLTDHRSRKVKKSSEDRENAGSVKNA
jgi:hypothetical protein